MGLATLRRLAYEASDTGLLSPELAAGIRRVRGAKRLRVRIGNWLTVDQYRTFLRESASDSLRGKRDRAILALLIGCGLRRAELASARDGRFPSPRGALGDRRLDWQRKAHQDSSRPGMGETRLG
jgi:integrase